MSAGANSQPKYPGAMGGSPHAPDILLPLRFVLAGLAGFGAGVCCLVWRPEILATYHYNQYVIAVTHLFVLGWISTLVMGAMYQLVPVALEARLHSERIARWQFLLHIVGCAGMVWMFWTWNLKQVGHFGTVLAVSVGLFCYNIFRTLRKVPRWNIIATAVASALVWITLGVLAGLLIVTGKVSFDSTSSLRSTNPLGRLLAGLRWLGGQVTRFDAIGAMHAHGHLGVLGVFIMLIVGISYRLLPMFTLSEVQRPWRARLSVALLNAGLLVSFVAILTRSRFKPVCAVVIVSSLVFYGWEVVAILRARKRRHLDWGVKYFVTAVALLAPLSLLGIVLAWPGLPLNPFTGQLENLYGFLGLVGVVSFAAIGMLYKIVPFLVWYRSYGRQIGFGKVPSLADLYCRHLQFGGYWTYVAGLVVTSVGILLGHPQLVRAGAALLSVSVVILTLNILKMLMHLVHPRTVAFAGSKSGIVGPCGTTLSPTALSSTH